MAVQKLQRCENTEFSKKWCSYWEHDPACPGTWSFRINLIENLIFSLAPSDGPIMS